MQLELTEMHRLEVCRPLDVKACCAALAAILSFNSTKLSEIRTCCTQGMNPTYHRTPLPLPSYRVQLSSNFTRTLWHGRTTRTCKCQWGYG
mmetsp:Transcript_28927/g.88733  ORF Transcript_28927/g.88733 Transcript_28927/m.88733 type:complete len:91 (+) Transcript_28927:652-924(+)